MSSDPLVLLVLVSIGWVCVKGILMACPVWSLIFVFKQQDPASLKDPKQEGCKSQLLSGTALESVAKPAVSLWLTLYPFVGCV